MSNNQITALLQQRKAQWRRFQQLRETNPDEAAIARDQAIEAEHLLSEEGFTVFLD
ncbi:MAG TPA: hypothetical protein V6C78_21565 [Crinalium sp.]